MIPNVLIERAVSAVVEDLGPLNEKKSNKTFTLRGRGHKPVTFKKGALHAQLGVPVDKPIPPGKKRDALAGEYGPLAKKRATAAFKGILKKGRKTAGKSESFADVQIEQAIDLVVAEQGTITAPTKPQTRPDVHPMTPKRPAPTPRSPIRPAPGITPRPKGRMNRDVKLFAKARK